MYGSNFSILDWLKLFFMLGLLLYFLKELSLFAARYIDLRQAKKNSGEEVPLDQLIERKKKLLALTTPPSNKKDIEEDSTSCS
jgi:hypothetical protein